MADIHLIDENREREESEAGLLRIIAKVPKNRGRMAGNGTPRYAEVMDDAPTPAPGRLQTPHEPPYPTVTLLPSTITGTWRFPPERRSISSSLTLSDFTSKYSALSPYADLALSV
jgi:hypothetical protein